MPVDVLKKVFDVLTNEGIVYIAVPNSYDPNLPLRKLFFSVSHPFCFSETSLRNIIGISGLEVIYLDTSHKSNELYAVCSKSKTPREPIISNSEYFKQKELIIEIMKDENRFMSKLKWSVGGRMVFLIPLLKKLNIYNVLSKIYRKI